MNDNTQKCNTSKIRETLLRLGLIDDKHVEVISKKTRDKEGLNVYQDKNSKIIFIDNYFVGLNEYHSGQYRNKLKPLMKSVGRDYEDLMDCERRFEKYSQFILGKNICDFGCGVGSFLRKSSLSAKYVSGIELQIDFSEALNRDAIDCFNDLQESTVTYDSIFLFHCFEHLQDPISILKEIYSKLKPCAEGRIVIEVPHARDFLIDKLCNKSFLDFTLWSQHLILHTRHSLGAMLNDAGFKNITIEGIQRYSIANHINWLKDSRPGGHKEPLSVFETQDLRESYALALSKIDANDTLVAIAST